MPSGKKKRRAIRKKKELGVHHVSVSHEIEALRRQDEDGDNGDVRLPASHGRRRTFNGESEEETKNDMLSFGSISDGNKLVEVPILSEKESSHGCESVETLEQPMPNDDSSIGIEPLLREICLESQVYGMKLEDEESSEVLGLENAQVVSLIQITDPLPKEVTVKEVVDRTNSTAQTSENTSLIQIIDPLPEEVTVTEVVDITKSTAQNSEDTSLIVQLDSAVTNTAQIISESEGTLVNRVSPASGFESGSPKFGAKVYPVSTSSSVLATDSNKPQPKSLQSSKSVDCQANFGLKRAEDTHVIEFSEKQPSVAPASRVSQRASWMNCCGILDLFSGSS